MSSPSTITSPRLMPMRSSMRLSAATPVFRSGIACCTRDRAAHRIDDAREFHQETVAGSLDDAALVLGDLRIEELVAQRFEAFEGAFLVRPHQPRMAGDIGGQDRGEAAGLAHVASPIARRRPEMYRSSCAGFPLNGICLGTTSAPVARKRSTRVRASSIRPI